MATNAQREEAARKRYLAMSAKVAAALTQVGDEFMQPDLMMVAGYPQSYTMNNTIAKILRHQGCIQLARGWCKPNSEAAKGASWTLYVSLRQHDFPNVTLKNLGINWESSEPYHPMNEQKYLGCRGVPHNLPNGVRRGVDHDHNN